MPTFIEASQPETEERHAAANRVAAILEPAPAQSGKRLQSIKPVTPEVHARFIDWREKNGSPSNAEVARMLGYSTAMVSNYANKVFRGDITAFEARVNDLLRGEGLRRNFGVPFLATSVTTQTAAFIDGVRAAGGVGVLHGDAGLGKSVGATAYARDNQTAIYLSANATQFDAKGAKQLVWSATPATGKAWNDSRWLHIVRTFAGSDRVFILDNAQRLDKSGRHFFYDLHDETGCPIVFVGNPVIIERIRADDQQFSRTLPQHQVRLMQPENIVAHILECTLGEVPDAIREAALEVALGKGHLRQLLNVAKGAVAYSEMPKFSGDLARAFAASLSASIRAPK